MGHGYFFLNLLPTKENHSDIVRIGLKSSYSFLDKRENSVGKPVQRWVLSGLIKRKFIQFQYMIASSPYYVGFGGIKKGKKFWKIIKTSF